jgi:hypothetical protein
VAKLELVGYLSEAHRIFSRRWAARSWASAPRRSQSDGRLRAIFCGRFGFGLGKIANPSRGATSTGRHFDRRWLEAAGQYQARRRWMRALSFRGSEARLGKSAARPPPRRRSRSRAARSHYRKICDCHENHDTVLAMCIYLDLTCAWLRRRIGRDWLPVTARAADPVHDGESCDGLRRLGNGHQ